MFAFTHQFLNRALSAVILAAGLAACAPPAEPPVAAETAAETNAADAAYFTGARLLDGTGGIIDDAVLVVRDGLIAAVAAAADVTIPAGAAQTDLSGKTVMPAIVDAHVHMSTEREALLRDLQRRAYFGVSAAISMGSDGAETPLEMRSELLDDAARYRSAGRGITRPEPGRTTVPHWIDTAEEGRAAVREEAARGVDLIKIWVDDRNGQYMKLTPELYSAIIDEAHASGLRVAAHIFSLDDAKGLVAAGVDVFAHGVRDRDIDDEFVALMQANPDIILIPNMPARGVATDVSWLEASLSAEDFSVAMAGAGDQPGVREAHQIQARNLKRLSDAGVRIAFGTDGNVPYAPHIEMEDMVAAGMSPAAVIEAATANAALAMGLADTGRLAAGMRADFLVLDADPLADISNTRRIADVYLAGVRVDRAAIAARERAR